jgi:hypothetical protein
VAAKDFCGLNVPTHNPARRAKYPVLLGRLKVWDFAENMSGIELMKLTP